MKGCGVHHLDKGHLVAFHAVLCGVLVGKLNGGLCVCLHGARAARCFLNQRSPGGSIGGGGGGSGTTSKGSVFVARRFVTHELALRLGAEFGRLALPRALCLLTHGRAHRLGGGARGAAHSRSADGLALGAVLELAHLLGASHAADGLLAVHVALGAFGLLAIHLALGASAHGVAFGGAHGVIAQPLALGVAGARRVLLSRHCSDDEDERE